MAHFAQINDSNVVLVMRQTKLLVLHFVDLYMVLIQIGNKLLITPDMVFMHSAELRLD